MNEEYGNRKGWRRYATKRSIAWALASVTILALVILGASALSSPKNGTDGGVDSALARITSLNKLAGDALASGETTAAQEYIARSVALDPTNEATKRLVVRIEQATRPSGSSSDDSPADSGGDEPDPADEPDPPASDDTYLKARENLAELLPAKPASGFSLGTPDGNAKSATVVELPVSAMGVERAILTVFDQTTASKAQAFVDGLDKAFPLKTANVNVGSQKGRYGVDSGGVTSVAFARGRFSFEVIVIPGQSSSSDLKTIAVALATSFPASQ